MKRDMDLVRKILLAIEEEYDGHSVAQVNRIEGYPDEQVHYTVKLLLAEGYIAGKATYAIRGLSWAGHDFLDAIRSPDVWDRVKHKLEAIGGQASIAVVKDTAVKIATEMLSR